MFGKNSKSQNVCWNFFDFFKYTKVSCVYFLNDSANFHRNIYNVLYALKCACFQNILKKILSPKMCVEIFYTVCSTMQRNVESMHDTNGEHTV